MDNLGNSALLKYVESKMGQNSHFSVNPSLLIAKFHPFTVLVKCLEDS